MFLILIITSIVLVVVYLKFKYFTLYGSIPGLSPHFFFGNMIQSGLLFNRIPLPHAIKAFKDRYGDIFQFWFGPSRVVVVGGLRDVQHVFAHRHIYDQGDFTTQRLGNLLPESLSATIGASYRRHAEVILPLFRRINAISNLDMIIDCADKLLANWRLKSPGYIHRDIVRQCQNIQLAIFGFIAYDYDLKTLDDDDGKSNNELAQALVDFLSTFQMIYYSPRFVSTMYLKLSRRHRRIQAIIERYVYEMMKQEMAETSESIAQRKKTWLIASLVGSLQKDEKVEAAKREEDKTGLSSSEIFHELLGFLISGFDTTSASMAWFIHLLSKHPQVQQKIKAELIEHGAKQDLSLERLDSLVYLDCVVSEVLRYAMPANGTVRTLTTDDRLPESGAQLFKGETVYIPFYNLSRDTRYWSIDPEIFYPERFLEKDKNHELYAFIPFGGGHRQCIGQDLARFELKVVIARLMQHVTICDGGPEVNAGGHLIKMIIAPKSIGVTIEFD